MISKSKMHFFLFVFSLYDDESFVDAATGGKLSAGQFKISWSTRSFKKVEFHKTEYDMINWQP